MFSIFIFLQYFIFPLTLSLSVNHLELEPDFFLPAIRSSWKNGSTINSFLNSFTNNDGCFSDSWRYNSRHLDSLRDYLQVRNTPRTFTVAFVGDSVTCGSGSSHGGYVAAMDYFLKKLFQNSNVKVTTRNNCAGGQKPKFFSLCNELEGDEDIVILETVYNY